MKMLNYLHWVIAAIILTLAFIALGMLEGPKNLHKRSPILPYEYFLKKNVDL